MVWKYSFSIYYNEGKFAGIDHLEKDINLWDKGDECDVSIFLDSYDFKGISEEVSMVLYVSLKKIDTYG